MKIEDKRKVIECLLCSGAAWNPLLFHAAAELGVDDRLPYQLAFGSRLENLYDDRSPNSYAYQVTEAAYRLIESSPTLRREWFARGK